MKMKLSSKCMLVLRHILHYVQFVILPVVLVLISLMYASVTLKQEIISSNKAALELVHTTLDSSFQEMNNIMRIAGADPALTRYQVLSDPINASAKIKDIIDMHSRLVDMIFSVRDEDQYCSSSAVFDRSSLPSQYFGQAILSSSNAQDIWVDMMQNTTSPVFWSGSSPYLFLITPVYYPLQTNGVIATRTASLIIHQDYVRNVFASSQSASEESMLLLDSSLEPLSKLTSRNTESRISEICTYIQNHPDIFKEGYAQIPGTDFLVFVSRSGESGLSYVRILSKNIAYSPLYTQRTFSIVFLILIAIFGVMVVIANIRSGYCPRFFFTNWRRILSPSGNSVQEEPLLFRSILEDTLRPKAVLSDQTDPSLASLTDHMLADLLCGNYISESDLLATCKKLDILLDKPYFAVCSLLVEEDRSDSTSAGFDRIVDCICEDAPSCYRIYAKDMLSAGKLILIINSDNNDLSFYQTTMAQVKTRLLEQEQLTVSIGMGFFYDSFEKINKSFHDSVSALDYRLIYGKNCLITPDIYNSSSPDISSSYPTHDLILLDSSLASHNAEMALTVLQRINATIKLKNYNQQITRMLCYDIFSILKKNADFTDVSNASSLPTLLNAADSSTPSTIDDFFASLASLISSASSSNPEPLSLNNIGAQLLEYVDAHCLSYDFQIKNMAEHFAISPQYMRKVFKAQSGMSVSEYVSSKRLEKSIYLLTQTDMSLQDIVAEIGNSDISGFVRFFKQKTGLTPGQYRKANRQSD